MSRSEKKLGLNFDDTINDSSDDSDSENVHSSDYNNFGNRIIDISILRNQIADQLRCRYCNGKVELQEVNRQGLGSTLQFVCQSNNKKCKQNLPFSSCPTTTNFNNYSINRRSVFAMRCIGGSQAKLETFCGLMDLPRPVSKSSYTKIVETVQNACVSVQARSMSKAGEEEFTKAKEIEGESVRNIDVSVDGSWMTKGHTSNIGTTSLIGFASGKVLDTLTKSKICKSCEYWANKVNEEGYVKWKESHVCTMTHSGSSGSMEADGAVEMFSRSVQNHKLRYTRYIGDGDTNSLKKVHDSNPYGTSCSIEKLECVGHVQKRMGTRLRKLKADNRGKKLADGKTLGGKGRLTDVQIDQITTYYGNAIRANKHNLEGMRKAIWAIYFHKKSCDKDAVHNFCGEWCSYRKAEKEGELASYKHKNNLPIAVMEVIRPIFKDLIDTSLLKKCLDGYTQNANESLNSNIWKLCPKNKNHGLRVAKIAVAIATSIYNDGAQAYAQMLEQLDLECSAHTARFLKKKDLARTANARQRAAKASLEYRRAKRRAAKESSERNEDGAYSTGAF